MKQLPKWYVYLEGEAIGPFSTSEVAAYLESGKLSWVSHVCTIQDRKWRRFCEVMEFQEFFPAEPDPNLSQDLKRGGGAPVIRPAKREWYVKQSQGEIGPFTQDEITRLKGFKRIEDSAEIWKPGMEKWEPLASEPLNVSLPEEKAVRTETGTRADRRKTLRRPLVASVILANREIVSSGLCRDVSMGGMQILMDGFVEQFGGKIGDTVLINVLPDGRNKGKEGFSAKGTVVRTFGGSADGAHTERGFSCRFEALSPEAARVIETLIK